MNYITLTRRVAAPAVTAALVAGGLALLSGCASEPETHAVSAPPPNVAVPTTAPGQIVVAQTPTPAGTVLLTQAPPSGPQVIVTQPARPGSDYVWVEGHWTYRNGRYEWINGEWVRPPFSGAVWIPPHTERQGSENYLFYEGHWSQN
jgi:hypothetical protein